MENLDENDEKISCMQKIPVNKKHQDMTESNACSDAEKVVRRADFVQLPIPHILKL